MTRAARWLVGIAVLTCARVSFGAGAPDANTEEPPRAENAPKAVEAPRAPTAPARPLHFGIALGATHRHVLTLPTCGGEVIGRVSGDRGHFEGAIDFAYTYARTSAGLSFHAAHPMFTASYIGGPARLGGGLGFGLLALERASAPRSVYAVTIGLHLLASVDVLKMGDAATLLLGLRGQIEGNLFNDDVSGGGMKAIPSATLLLGARF